MCRWSNPAQLHYRHGLPSIRLASRSVLQVNQLAHSQVAKNSYRVVRRTLQQSSNGPDTLAVEPVFRFQPTNVAEGFADLLFFIRSQLGHFVMDYNAERRRQRLNKQGPDNVFRSFSRDPVLSLRNVILNANEDRALDQQVRCEGRFMIVEHRPKCGASEFSHSSPIC